MSRQTITPDLIGQNGVLTKMVQQPIDNAIEISWQDGARYTEKWKGPYHEMKEVTKDGGLIMGKAWKVGFGRPVLDDNWVSLINIPQPVTGMAWMIDTIEVTEIEAGAHGELLITYKAVSLDDLPMVGYGGKEPSSETSSEVVTESSGWTLRWGTYSRNVLEYCTNLSIYHVDDPSDHAKIAHADCVIKCSQLPKPRKSQIPSDWRGSGSSHPEQYMWVEPNQAGESVSADVRELGNDKERKIYDYYTRGVQPVFHYPVLTYTYTAEYGADYTGKFYVADELVDTKETALPTKCPFDLDGWEWLHCGTEAQVRKVKKTTRNVLQVTKTTTWEGALKFDDNFYGQIGTRWEPGTYTDGTYPAPNA